MKKYILFLTPIMVIVLIFLLCLDPHYYSFHITGIDFTQIGVDRKDKCNLFLLKINSKYCNKSYGFLADRLPPGANIDNEIAYIRIYDKENNDVTSKVYGDGVSNELLYNTKYYRGSYYNISSINQFVDDINNGIGPISAGRINAPRLIKYRLGLPSPYKIVIKFKNSQFIEAYISNNHSSFAYVKDN